MCNVVQECICCMNFCAFCSGELVLLLAADKGCGRLVFFPSSFCSSHNVCMSTVILIEFFNPISQCPYVNLNFDRILLIQSVSVHMSAVILIEFFNPNSQFRQSPGKNPVPSQNSRPRAIFCSWKS